MITNNVRSMNTESDMHLVTMKTRGLAIKDHHFLHSNIYLQLFD